MKRVIIIAVALCFPLIALAECPVVVPAEERTRIVECTDGSYAIQRLDTAWVAVMGGCGYDLEDARSSKWWLIVEDIMDDAIACPPPPVQPRHPPVIVR